MKLLLCASLLITFVATQEAFSMVEDFRDEKTLRSTLSQYGRKISNSQAFRAGSSNNDLWDTTSINQNVQNILGIAPTDANITRLINTLHLNVIKQDSNHFTAQFHNQNHQTVISISFERYKQTELMD